MDEDIAAGPQSWVEELARSDAELARGELVPAHAVHRRLREALARLEAKIAAGTTAEGGDPPHP